MESAPELAILFEKILDLAWGEPPNVEGHLDGWSRHPGILFIGPDPDEWSEGFEQFAATARVQFPEQLKLGGICFETDRSLAWKEGSVGWVAWRGQVGVRGSPLNEARMTAILHEDGPHWKLVHMQFAFTVSNLDALGSELTTAVDDLLLAVANEAPPPTGMSVDGSVTIMFTDLESSTTLMEALGEVRWLELLAWHDGIVTQQAATFGGTVVKNQGDGFMIAFPASGSAAACAVAIQRAISAGWQDVNVAMRIGLHAGNATAEAGDFFGRTVVLAARIANAADGGQILVSEAVQHDLAGAFTLGGARHLTLKGLAGNYEALPVVWT
jgi:adenylate cyclase